MMNSPDEFNCALDAFLDGRELEGCKQYALTIEKRRDRLAGREWGPRYESWSPCSQRASLAPVKAEPQPEQDFPPAAKNRPMSNTVPCSELSGADDMPANRSLADASLRRTESRMHKPPIEATRAPSYLRTMFAARELSRRRVFSFALRSGGVAFAWASLVFVLYAVAGMPWLRVPFLPISVMGIAVSFYAGFKNNASYERFWEARKIWGAIVNESRSWADAVLCYVMPGDGSEAARSVRRELVVRQLAWVNALRLQLRATSRLEGRLTSRGRLRAHADVLRNDWSTQMRQYSDDEALNDARSCSIKSVCDTDFTARSAASRASDGAHTDRLNHSAPTRDSHAVHRPFALAVATGLALVAVSGCACDEGFTDPSQIEFQPQAELRAVAGADVDPYYLVDADGRVTILDRVRVRRHYELAVVDTIEVSSRALVDIAVASADGDAVYVVDEAGTVYESFDAGSSPSTAARP
jgi:hypothetical protein